MRLCLRALVRFDLRCGVAAGCFTGLVGAAAWRVGAEGAVWIHGWCQDDACEGSWGWSGVLPGELPSWWRPVVSNHLSYLDILLYSAVTAVCDGG